MNLTERDAKAASEFQKTKLFIPKDQNIESIRLYLTSYAAKFASDELAVIAKTSVRNSTTETCDCLFL